MSKKRTHNFNKERNNICVNDVQLWNAPFPISFMDEGIDISISEEQ